MKSIKRITITFILILFPLIAFAQDDYSFDMSEIEKEIEKKPYTLGGYLELLPKIYALDHDAALYKLNFYIGLRKIISMNIMSRCQ